MQSLLISVSQEEQNDVRTEVHAAATCHSRVHLLHRIPVEVRPQMHVLTVLAHDSSLSMLRCVIPGLQDLQDMTSMKRTFQQAPCPHTCPDPVTDRLLYEARDDLDREDAFGFDIRRFSAGGNYIDEFSVLHRQGGRIFIYFHLPDLLVVGRSFLGTLYVRLAS